MLNHYNRTNFHSHTFCIFHEVENNVIPEIVDYTSKSGSKYSFTQEGVFRTSNHWGRAANCKWRLESTIKSESRTKTGFARWSDFYKDNDIDKLYWIRYDSLTESVHYFHKDDNAYGGEFVRTAGQTVKRIREIRSLLHDVDFKSSTKETKEKAILYLLQNDGPLRKAKMEFLNPS